MGIYNFSKPMDISTSRFATDEEFSKASVIVDENEIRPEKAGVVMMDMGNGKIAMGDEELHSFVIGESGCGKTRRIVIPTIDMVSRCGKESMVIADPKGEIYEKTAETLRKRGYTVHCLDFTNPFSSNRWNPLEVTARAYGKGGMEDAKGRKLLREIIQVMKASVHSDRDMFWEEQAGKLIYGICMLILKHGKPEDLTFRNVSYNLKEILSRNEDFASYYNDMPSDSEEKEYLTPIQPEQDERTTFSVKITAEGMLDTFCQDDMLLSLFDSSDFDIMSLGKEKTALFLILSDSSKSLYPIATVLIKELYTLLLDQADSNERKMLDVPVFFILDEFANFTKIPDVDSMLTAARSRGIRFMLVCQSMLQLHEKYGNNAAEILMSNCRIWIYMNSRDIRFLERLSKLIGQVKNKYTGEKECLVEIDELQHLDKGEVIVLNDRCYPIRGYLKDYSEYCRLEKANGKPVAYYEYVPQYRTIDLLSKWKYPKELEEDMDFPVFRHDDGNKTVIDSSLYGEWSAEAPASLIDMENPDLDTHKYVPFPLNEYNGEDDEYIPY